MIDGGIRILRRLNVHVITIHIHGYICRFSMKKRCMTFPRKGQTGTGGKEREEVTAELSIHLGSFGPM